jgi:hypothetical protein
LTLDGEGPAPIFASSRDEFFYRVVDAQIRFVRDSTGKGVSPVLHQAGRNLPASRMP